MTENINDINKAIAYEIIMAMGDDGMNTLLTADDILVSMAVPVTQFDFTYADRSKLKSLMQSVEKFVRSSRLNVNSYTKAGLQAKFEKLWLPSLSEEQKQEVIAEYRMVDGFNEDGYAIFNEASYDAWKGIFDKGQTPTLKYKVPQFGKAATSVELIDNRPFTTYHEENVDGYIEVLVDITAEEWEKIIVGATTPIKRMLQCYLQAGRGNRHNLFQMEEMFGIKSEALSGSVVALGRRAQKMLNFAVIDTKDPDIRHYWSTPTTRTRKENGLWVWELRPELLDAAEKVLREEKFPEIKRL